MKKVITSIALVCISLLTFTSCKKTSISDQENGISNSRRGGGGWGKGSSNCGYATIYAYESALFGERNQVNGDVVVMSQNGKFDMKKNSSCSTGTVTSPQIIVENPCYVP